MDKVSLSVEYDPFDPRLIETCPALRVVAACQKTFPDEPSIPRFSPRNAFGRHFGVGRR
jgi:hypothetical protein